MKIIHIGSYNKNPQDGVSSCINEQTKALKKIGIDVEIWSFSNEVAMPVLLNENTHCPVWVLPSYSRKLSLLFFGFKKTSKNWICKRLPEVTKFHLHSVFTPYNNLIASLGKPYIITPNGGWQYDVLFGRNRITKWIWIFMKEKSLWHNASFVQAVSKAELDHLKNTLNISKVVYIPNGCFVSDVLNSPNERDISCI